MATRNVPKVSIIADFSEEYAFVKERYVSARRAIGVDTFRKIIAFNIPGAKAQSLPGIQKEVIAYLDANALRLRARLAAEKVVHRKIWREFEKLFFEETSRATGLSWQYATYRIHLTASCFWGGDYDENARDVYINPLLKQGDPLYVTCHELSHLLYWEYLHAHYSKSFIARHRAKLWELSEIMVNYPLIRAKAFPHFPLVIPPDIVNGKSIAADFSRKSYLDILDCEIKKIAR